VDNPDPTWSVAPVLKAGAFSIPLAEKKSLQNAMRGHNEPIAFRPSALLVYLASGLVVK